MPSGDIYPQAIVADGRRMCRAQQGVRGAQEGEAVPRRLGPTAPTATRCSRCSALSPAALAFARCGVKSRGFKTLGSPFFLIYPLLTFTYGVAQSHIPEEKVRLIPESFGSQNLLQGLAAARRRFLGHTDKQAAQQITHLGNGSYSTAHSSSALKSHILLFQSCVLLCTKPT